LADSPLEHTAKRGVWMTPEAVFLLPQKRGDAVIGLLANWLLFGILWRRLKHGFV